MSHAANSHRPPSQMQNAGQAQQPNQQPNQQAPAATPKEISGKTLLNELLEGRSVSYTPTAEGQDIFLTVALVQQHLCVPTKMGHRPGQSECVKFIMMCKARGLNPWTGDCYLLGYDSEQRGPTFSLVVAIQALLKRAELARTLEGKAAFDSLESGVIVLEKWTGEDGQQHQQISEQPGDIVFDGQTLLGGWAKVNRTDRGKPFYQRLKLQTYVKPTQIWKQDPAGMICKDAEAAALRQAFPSDLGGMFLASEIEAFAEAAAADKTKLERPTIDLETLTSPKGGAVAPYSPSGAAPQGQKTDTATDSQSSPGPQTAAGEPTGDDPGVNPGGGFNQDGFNQDTGPQDDGNQTGEPPAGEQQSGEQTGEADEEPADPVGLQHEIENFKVDIAAAGTMGRLDQICKELESSHPQVRKEVLQVIAAKRAELKAPKGKQKPAASAGGTLPGVS